MDTRNPRALIADDEPMLAADLATRLGRLWPELDIAAVVHHGPAALEALQSLRPDIAFLDIRMPGLSGLEVAALAQVPHLVFVTAYDQHAVEAFEREAIDYLLKPVSDERLQQAIERVKKRCRTSAPDEGVLLQVRDILQSTREPERLQWIRANRGQELHLVAVAEVLYFRSDEKYTLVQTAQREYLIRIPLKELLPQLDPQCFWQIHRNTIVNVTAISLATRDWSGRMALSLRERPEVLSVSRAFAHLFKQM